MINVFKDKQELSKKAAEIFIKTAKDAVNVSGRFTVALTGGSSPQLLYKLLAEKHYRDQVEWEKVWVFWGDERWVPLDDERSNAKMAFDLLLDHVPIPMDQVFIMWDKEQEPEEFARKYQQLLQQHIGKSSGLDLILLGMGEDGHTASLFPKTEVLQEQSKWVTAYYLEAQEMYRITLTAPFINMAHKILFMVFGSNKSHALREILEGNHRPEQYPAKLIRPHQGEIIWLVDEGAAQDL